LDVVIGGRGNDTVYGDDDADEITGVNPHTRFAERGDIDTLIGDVGDERFIPYNRGADRFILGNIAQIFYDDSQAGTVGTSDYALIQDFSLTQGDSIQLKGTAQDYRLDLSDVAAGTAVFWHWGQSVAELVAIVQGDALTSLNHGFDFV
jgi:serralysin